MAQHVVDALFFRKTAHRLENLRAFSDTKLTANLAAALEVLVRLSGVKTREIETRGNHGDGLCDAVARRSLSTFAVGVITALTCSQNFFEKAVIIFLPIVFVGA